MTFIANKTANPSWEVAHTGTLEGKTSELVSIFGYRSQWASTTVQGDICPYLVGGQTTMNTPSSATTLYIVSTSAQDTTGGTGVDRLRIVYLDASGNEQTVVANLNGTTAVSIGTGFSFIQWMESYHSVTANRLASGNLTISSTNGAATEATTFEMIRENTNRSESFRYKVPRGKHAHCLDWHTGAIKQGASQTYEISLRATQFSNNGISNTYHFVDTSAIVDGQYYTEDLHYKEFGEGVVIKASCIPSSAAAGNTLRGGLDIILMSA